MGTEAGVSTGGAAAHGHAAAHGVSGHGHEPSPKPAGSVVPCCLAGCFGLAVPAAATVDLVSATAPTMFVPAVLAGWAHEPAEPPPRPDFLSAT